MTQLVKELPNTVGTLGGAARGALQGGLLNSVLFGGKGGSGNLALAPKTPFNASVTDGRAFAAVSLPLAELKAIGKAHEATINDMVLMVVSTALRRHLGKKHALPKKSLIAAVPISLRAAGDTTSDNQASMSLISLGTHVADPMKRLQHIRQASAAMKSTLGSVKSRSRDGSSWLANMRLPARKLKRATRAPRRSSSSLRTLKCSRSSDLWSASPRPQVTARLTPRGPRSRRIHSPLRPGGCQRRRRAQGWRASAQRGTSWPASKLRSRRLR